MSGCTTAEGKGERRTYNGVSARIRTEYAVHMYIWQSYSDRSAFDQAALSQPSRRTDTL